MDRATSRILIVDDEPQLLRVLTRYLAKLSYGVVATVSTKEAWNQFLADPTTYALVLIDMTMPGMSSAELMQRMRQVNPSIHLIACSGYPIEVKEIGLTGEPPIFLQKPFSPDNLLECVKALLEGKGDSAKL